jgi:hypothetical protein
MGMGGPPPGIFSPRIPSPSATASSATRLAKPNISEFIPTGKSKVIAARPILDLLGGKRTYERFVLAGMSEDHNKEYYTVEDQRFLGDEGFGEEVSRAAGEKGRPKRKKSTEADFQKLAKQFGTAADLLRGRDRRCDTSAKRAKVVAVLVREQGHRVSDVAKFLRRDQANISMMLLRASSQDPDQFVESVISDPEARTLNARTRCRLSPVCGG